MGCPDNQSDPNQRIIFFDGHFIYNPEYRILSVAVYALLPAGTFLDLALLFEVGSWNLFKK